MLARARVPQPRNGVLVLGGQPCHGQHASGCGGCPHHKHEQCREGNVSPGDARALEQKRRIARAGIYKLLRFSR
jgi:hypothetical protein